MALDALRERFAALNAETLERAASDAATVEQQVVSPLSTEGLTVRPSLKRTFSLLFLHSITLQPIALIGTDKKGWCLENRGWSWQLCDQKWRNCAGNWRRFLPLSRARPACGTPLCLC